MMPDYLVDFWFLEHALGVKFVDDVIYQSDLFYGLRHYIRGGKCGVLYTLLCYMDYMF